MRERLKSIDRVLKVRETMRRQEESKLAEHERAGAELRAAQERLGAFLDGNAFAGGPLMEMLARSARSLSERIAVAERARIDQTGRLLEETRKTRLAERRRDEVAVAVRREDERRQLAEWVELAGTDRTVKH